MMMQPQVGVAPMMAPMGGMPPMGGMAPMGAAPMGGPPPMQQGGMTPMQQGLGYDQYLAMLGKRGGLGQGRMPGPVRMPAPPPRFPTPGRMDGSRSYGPRGGAQGMMF